MTVQPSMVLIRQGENVPIVRRSRLEHYVTAHKVLVKQNLSTDEMQYSLWESFSPCLFTFYLIGLNSYFSIRFNKRSVAFPSRY